MNEVTIIKRRIYIKLGFEDTSDTKRFREDFGLAPCRIKPGLNHLPRYQLLCCGRDFEGISNHR